MLEVKKQVTVNAASSSSSSVAGITVNMTEPKMVSHQTTEKPLIKVKKEKSVKPKIDAFKDLHYREDYGEEFNQSCLDDS
jgi:hypothetical protein